MANNVLSQEAIPNKEITVFAAGRHVVPQTLLLEAATTDQVLSEVTRVLMDTGSSRTYVTEEIVTKFKLNYGRSNLHFWKQPTKRNHVTSRHLDADIK